MTPPCTLLRLVVAPMMAPAAAPIAASRWVCFTTTSPPDDEVVVPTVVPELKPELTPELLLPLDVDRRRGALAVVVRGVVDARSAAALFGSRAEMLSRWLCCC